jgi:hypothetical protein
MQKHQLLHGFFVKQKRSSLFYYLYFILFLTAEIAEAALGIKDCKVIIMNSLHTYVMNFFFGYFPTRLLTQTNFRYHLKHLAASGIPENIISCE